MLYILLYASAATCAICVVVLIIALLAAINDKLDWD